MRSGADAVRPGHVESASELPAVDVKEVPATTVVFLEQVAAYWNLGPSFRQVADYMRAHGETGPMFARYCGGNAKIIALPPVAASCPTQVGFVAREDHEPEPPLKITRRARELVAYVIVDGPYAPTLRFYAPLLEWIDNHGYVPLGPITELYLPGAGAFTGNQRTEIQISVALRGTLAHSEAGPEPSDAPGNQTASPQTDTTLPFKVEGQRSKVQGRKRVDVQPSSRQEVEGPRPEGRRSGMDPGQDSAEPTVPTKADPKPTEAKPQAAGPEPVQPVRELVALQRWDRVAEQLMPNGHDIPAALQVWFGQIVFRTRALAKGIRNLDPDKKHGIVALAQAIAQRYQTVSARFTLDPLAQAVVRIDLLGDRNALERRRLLRDLDTLLGRVAQKALEPNDALTSLTDIIQRLQDLLHPDQP